MLEKLTDGILYFTLMPPVNNYVMIMILNG